MALELNLPVSLVTEIVNSQFEFVALEMAKGEQGNPETYKTILLKYLGTFKFSRRKHDKIVEKLEKKLKSKKLINEEHSREL